MPQSEPKPIAEDAWENWEPDQLASKLNGINSLWYVVGGWAIEMHVGKPIREHADLEFCVLPDDANHTANWLSELTFFAAKDGDLKFWPADHEIYADNWQFWGAELKASKWRVDMMIERGTAATWAYKRDSSIQQARTDALRINSQGVRYLAPSNVLLFKAKNTRPKDDLDFDAVLPVLTAEERLTLLTWLQLLHPNHHWIPRLA